MYGTSFTLRLPGFISPSWSWQRTRQQSPHRPPLLLPLLLVLPLPLHQRARLLHDLHHHDLCHRFTSAQHSRHIDRKLYKMREMRGAGRVTVKYVPTDDNTADIFTKVLSRQPFEKHRRTLLNLAAMPQT